MKPSSSTAQSGDLNKLHTVRGCGNPATQGNPPTPDTQPREPRLGALTRHGPPPASCATSSFACRICDSRRVLHLPACHDPRNCKPCNLSLRRYKKMACHGTVTQRKQGNDSSYELAMRGILCGKEPEGACPHEPVSELSPWGQLYSIPSSRQTDPGMPTSANRQPGTAGCIGVCSTSKHASVGYSCQGALGPVVGHSDYGPDLPSG